MPYKQLSENTYLFEGKANIAILEEVLDLSEGEMDDCRGEAETVAGLMLEAKKEFLKKGDRLVLHGLRLTVEKVSGHYAEEIRVEKIKK
jgi:CBS domain containing-hemolysin-like protein